MNKKSWLLLTLLVTMALVLAACAGGVAPAPAEPQEEPQAEAPAAEEMAAALADGKLTIAWIPKALNNPVFEIGKVGAEAKAAELTATGPYEVEILYTASVASDAAEQARVMEDAIAAGVDAIGVSCNDPTACIDPINKAIEAGIEVMTWDSDSPDSDRFTYLGVDNYEGGVAAADLLKKALPDGGQVAVLTGVPGAFNLEERIRGFKDGIEGSNLELVTTVACNDDINLGVQVVEETMQAYPDLDGWFFVGLWPLFADRGSMPLWEEAAQAGMKTVAFDTLPVELEYVKDGLLYGLVGQKYWGWGYDTTQMVYDKIVNGAAYDSFTNSGMDIVTAANVEAMAEAWETSDFTQPLPPAFPEEGEMAGAPMADALADGKLTIAWIPKALNNPVFEIGKVGAEAKAAELTAAGPYEVEILYTASVASDAAEQARVMEDAIAAGVDAIGVSCNDPTACIDPINKAIEAGVPVMTWDSDAPDSDRFTYLGVDNYEGGVAAADLLKKALPDGGQVAVLTGVPGAFNLEERIRGFKDGVEGSNLEIVTTVACNDDINLGVQVVEETMQAYPDLDGWFFVGLWPLFADRGSMPLWEEAALAGMKTVAFDTLPVELEYVKDGLLYGLVGQKYWGWGYDTTQMIYDKIVNGATYDSFTNSGMDIVTAANVEAMAQAWETSDFTQPLPPAFPEEGEAMGGEMSADMAALLEDGKLTIAWIPKALNNPVFEIGKVGAEAKAAELTAAGPYEVEILYTASVASDAAEQARVMEDALAAGVDAIGVSCNDPTACIDPIDKAVADGIPVMTWDSDAPDSQRFTYLGVDNYEGGVAAAELLKEALPDGGQVAVLTGVPGAFNLEERIRGFKDGIEGSNLELVTTVACNDDINLGVQVVEETMQAYPDLDGWFFVGLWPLFADRGSMPLWEEAALAGMQTVAFDTLPVELEYVKDGLLYGLVGQKYWGWGYDTTQMIYDKIVSGATYDFFTNSGMDIVTAKNVDAMAEAWETQDFTKPLPPHN